MRRLLILLALLSVAASARADTSSTDLIKHLTGSHDAVAVRLQLHLSLPELQKMRPVHLTGEGSIPYQRFEGMARIRAEDFPPFLGSIRIGLDAEEWPRGELRGIPETFAEIRWQSGSELTLEGLNLRGLVYVDDDTEPYLSLIARNLHLTTGVIEVAGKSYRGELNIEEQKATFVGTTLMPATGKAKIDEAIAGQPVLIYLTASPQEMH